MFLELKAKISKLQSNHANFSFNVWPSKRLHGRLTTKKLKFWLNFL